MLHLLDELRFNNPWRDLDRLSSEVGRFLPRAQASVSPYRRPVNIFTNENGIKVLLSIPGWKAEWLNLSVVGQKLLLKGETVAETEGGATEKLNRVVNLPFRVQDDEVEASYKNGILTVDMVRCELDKPKKIEIHAA